LPFGAAFNKKPPFFWTFFGPPAKLPSRLLEFSSEGVLMKKAIALCLSVLFFGETLVAVDSKGAEYVGGTVTVYTGAKDPVEGLLDTTNAEQLVFTATAKNFKGKTFAIPYIRLIDVEYGQKAGRRVGTTVATVLLDPSGCSHCFPRNGSIT
jgi:hypothetical protein